jgi:hypothetical protein
LLGNLKARSILRDASDLFGPSFCLQLGAIDGPLPDALTGQGQSYMPMTGMGNNNMMMAMQAGQGMQQMHQGIPGVNTSTFANFR